MLWRVLLPCAVIAAISVAVWQHQVWPLRHLPDLDLSKATPSVRQSIEDARAEVESRPRSGSAWGLLGSQLRAHEFGASADQCLAMAEALAPEEMRWPYLRGVGLEAEAPEAAERLFRRAASLAPQELLPRLRLAELALKRQDLDQAWPLIEEVLKLDPQNGRAMLAKAHVLAQKGDAASALEWAHQANTAAPGKRAIVQLLADLSRRTGNQIQAEAMQTQLKALPEQTLWDDPIVAEVLMLRRDPPWLAQAADELAAVGRIEEAASLLQQAIEDDPDNPEWKIRLGRLWIRADAIPGATAIVTQGLRQHPDSAELHFLKGVIACRQSRWDEATVDLQQALKLNPDHAEAHFNLAQACLARKDRLQGQRELEAALKANPDLQPALVRLAQILLENGQPDEARNYLERSRKLNPDDPETQRLLVKLRK